MTKMVGEGDFYFSNLDFSNFDFSIFIFHISEVGMFI